MVKQYIFFYLLVFSTLISRSQGINNIWLMGYSGGGGLFQINFDSTPIMPIISPRIMSFDAAEANISDKDGNLLFYSNGIYIADASHDTMQNGGSISIGSFANQFNNHGIPVPQEVIILPNPDDSSKFYLFYQTNSLYLAGRYMPHALFYCEIDMNQNFGLGAVINKNIILLSDTLIAGEITACKHANGRDWWLISHRYMSDEYYKFLITPHSVSGPFTQNIGSFMMYRGLGQSCFSPDGKKFACYHPLEDLDVMDFDRCTGNFSNFIHVSINDSAAAGGVAFSSNSKLLYVSSTKYVYQINLNDTNITSSMTTVATWDGFYSPFSPFATTFYLAQLAPDNKIYINSTNGVGHLHVINEPDSFGIACNLAQHSIVLPAFNACTIPNHPNYFLGADSGSVCDTLQLGIKSTQQKIPLETVNVFPNPALDYLQVNYIPSNYVKPIQIIDVNGKVILERKLAQYSQMTRIDVSKFLAGIYLCKITYRDKSVTCKFVKE